MHYVAKKGGVLVGFHERRSSFVADTMSCEVLPPRGLEADPGAARDVHRDEAARPPAADRARGGRGRHRCLVLRNLEPIGEERCRRSCANSPTGTASSGGCSPKGPETAHPFYPRDAPALDYTLPEFGLRIGFGPTEFTQVNAGVNRVLVKRAVRHARSRGRASAWAISSAGSGNFTLPLATARR